MRVDTPAFLTELSKARRALITTHVRPDGDAIGSVAAMVLALRAGGVHAEALLLSHLPTKYAFVFEQAGITPYHDAERGAGIPPMDGYDTLIVVDTGTYSQLPGLEPIIPAFPGNVLVLDHHQTQENWAKARLVDTAASSAAELAWRTLSAWGTRLTPQLALAVYVGVASDTGWFQFSNTTPTTLRLAADLMEAGVDPDAIYQKLYLSEREARLRLQTRALQSMQILAGGKLSVMTLSRRDFEQTLAAVPDTENVINLPLAIGTVEMSLLAVEPPEEAKAISGAGRVGVIRVSCRSKGRVDVARFAEQFGGGGHARASGLKIPLPLDQAVKKVIQAAESALGGGD